MVQEEFSGIEAIKDRVRHYETIFVLVPALSDADAKAVVEKNVQVILQKGGQILRQDDWGKRRMAYPIAKHQMGRYIYLRFISNSFGLRELERSLKLDAQVIRYSSSRLSDPLSESEIADLVERAPREFSSVPTVRNEEDDIDAQYSAQS